MPLDGRAREARYLLVRDGLGVFELVGEGAEAAAEDERDAHVRVGTRARMKRAACSARS